MKQIIGVFIICLILPLYATSYFPFDHNVQTKETINLKNNHHHSHIDSTSTLNIVALWTIRFFQIFISPQDGPNCIYYPTCSRYGYISIKRYGALKGLLMTGDRWLRCNPFGYPGYDAPEDNYFFRKKGK